jgi:hypothetical protein
MDKHSLLVSYTCSHMLSSVVSRLTSSITHNKHLLFGYVGALTETVDVC